MRSALRKLGLALVGIAALTADISAQTARSLSQVTKVYLAPVKGAVGAAEIHEALARQLRKSSVFRLVDSPAAADAVLSGNSQLWVKGTVATNPRVPSSHPQPVFGGFLSIEMTGANQQPLWSYLATPSRFSFASITDDLSAQSTRELLRARAADTNPAVASAAGAQVAVTLRGAGATFPEPLYRKWIDTYRQQQPGTELTYWATGSSEGIRLLTAKEVDFAASDIPAAAGEPDPFERIPTVMGAVVPIYNVKGLDRDLRFTPELLAEIFLGQVTRWNAPQVHDLNRGAHLPDAAIVVVHRTDGSGTTYNFSDFLARTSPLWKSQLGVGTTLQWPVGVGAALNEGVADAVASTPNSIGYTELAYAIQNQLSYGEVRNRAGNFVHASLATLAEAVKSAQGSGILNAPGGNAYPIAAFTWLLLPAPDASASTRRAALAAFLEWVLTTGQKQCSALGYAPLPRELALRELDRVHTLK